MKIVVNKKKNEKQKSPIVLRDTRMALEMFSSISPSAQNSSSVRFASRGRRNLISEHRRKDSIIDSHVIVASL